VLYGDEVNVFRRHHARGLWGSALLVCTLLTPLTVVSSQETTGSADSLSRSFSHAALKALADIHRWKEKARYDAQGREPAPAFGKYLKITARESLSQAKLTATTEGDRRAGEALESLFAKMSSWTDNLISARARLDATHAMDPDSVEKDEVFTSIGACERSLHSMIISRNFSDQPLCR
jgi:hypothetical protein